MTSRRPIFSLGSINADFHVRVDRRPEPGETLIGRDFRALGGGKAANVALLAMRLGHPAHLFGRVGNDALAEQALAPLRLAGVDLSGVSPVDGCATAVSMISVPPDGDKGIVLAPNANDRWDEDGIAALEANIAGAPEGAVLVLDCEVPAEVAARAAAAAGRRRLTRVLDPSPAERVDDALLAEADFVLPNSAEAEALTGIAIDDAASGARAARRLIDRGAGAACVKLPGGGSVLAERGRLSLVRAPQVDVTDTTGAGDAFAGAFAVALAEGRDPVEAVRFATAAASHVVTGYGSQPAYPDREDVERLLAGVQAEPLDPPD
ncbi:PfkB family carbohydrate kinase [Roseitranquillus sediminis]|uniref:PfkB family carbohydrate kinase n=1 Tax=Roseitranquillus sediminis TaxID=2809051 RepID=UPI001D0C93D1|nr:PfkB family carbohydrate kinase [Roseitranquillus sediminis]MBM9595731.1 bifunctional hydroxymethylpyrimidine kinase/phosphomethylpyrimidine kinase [Roseitranquillus sediminis]